MHSCSERDTLKIINFESHHNIQHRRLSAINYLVDSIMASLSATVCPWQKYRQCFNYKFIILTKNTVILSVFFLHYSENLSMLAVLI